MKEAERSTFIRGRPMPDGVKHVGFQSLRSPGASAVSCQFRERAGPNCPQRSQWFSAISTRLGFSSRVNRAEPSPMGCPQSAAAPLDRESTRRAAIRLARKNVNRSATSAAHQEARGADSRDCATTRWPHVDIKEAVGQRADTCRGRRNLAA